MKKDTGNQQLSLFDIFEQNINPPTPMDNLNKVTATDGTNYILKQTPETELKAALQNYKARQLFNMMQEQQPERFRAMRSDNSLVPFLNQVTEEYYSNMRALIQEGMNEPDAAENQWPELLKKAGLT